ncbi:MAG: hypothetical protein ACTSU2_01180 [Promethearchaeota archaeon]
MLVGILVVIRFPTLFGDDPWFHIAMVNIIDKYNSLSITYKYYNLFGFYSISAIFSITTNIDLITLARVLPILNTLFICLIGFSIINLFVNNEQLSILGTVIFLITPMDFALVYSQFWPSALVISQALVWYYILFKNRIERDTKKPSIKNSILLLVIGSSMFFVHDFTALLIIGGGIFIFLIQTLRDYKKNFIFLRYSIYIFLISIVLKLWFKNEFFSQPILEILAKLNNFYIFAIILIVSLFILSLNRIINYPNSGKYKIERKGFLGLKKKKIERLNHNTVNITKNKIKITDYFFRKSFLRFLMLICFILIFILNYIVPNYLLVQNNDLQTKFIYSINSSLTLLIVILSVVGIITFQIKNYKSDILFFWIIYFLFLIITFFIFDRIVNTYLFWIRIAVISAGIVSIGVPVYIKLILEEKSHYIKNKKVILYSFMILLIINFNFYSLSNKWYNTNSEINTLKEIINKMGNTNNKTVIGDFRWFYPSNYYSNFSFTIDWQDSWLFFEKFQNSEQGQNYLNNLKNNSQEIFFIIDKKQFDYGTFGQNNLDFGKLNNSDLQYFYNSPKYSKIFSNRNTKDFNIIIFYF